MAQRALLAAKVEARSAYRGLGLVRLMGRSSGYIAMQASMASGVPHVDKELGVWTVQGPSCRVHAAWCGCWGAPPATSPCRHPWPQARPTQGRDVLMQHLPPGQGW